MKIVALLLALLCGQVTAAPYVLDCAPKTWWSAGTGSEWIWGQEEAVKPTGSAVRYAAWWCPDGRSWKPYVFRAIKRTWMPEAQFVTALDTAMRSADPVAGLKALIAANETPPISGESDDWAYAEAIALNRLALIRPADKGPPPLLRYTVTGPQAFPLNPDGSKSIKVWPTPPIKGETCDCNTAITQFGATFCKVPRLSATQTVIAGCSIVK